MVFFSRVWPDLRSGTSIVTDPASHVSDPASMLMNPARPPLTAALLDTRMNFELMYVAASPATGEDDVWG